MKREFSAGSCDLPFLRAASGMEPVTLGTIHRRATERNSAHPEEAAPKPAGEALPTIFLTDHELARSSLNVKGI
jgi:hypothetical protein